MQRLAFAACAAGFIYAGSVSAQALPETSSCTSLLRYSDGRIPEERNLQIGDVLVHPQLPGVPFPINPGTTSEQVCRQAAPFLGLISQKNQTIRELRRDLETTLAQGKSDREFRIQIMSEKNLMRKYPLEATILVFLLTIFLMIPAMLLIHRFKRWLKAQREKEQEGAGTMTKIVAPPRPGTFITG